MGTPRHTHTHKSRGKAVLGNLQALQGPAWGPQHPDARRGLKRTWVSPEHQGRMRHMALPPRLEWHSSSSHSLVLLAPRPRPVPPLCFSPLHLRLKEASSFPLQA